MKKGRKTDTHTERKRLRKKAIQSLFTIQILYLALLSKYIIKYFVIGIRKRYHMWAFCTSIKMKYKMYFIFSLDKKTENLYFIRVFQCPFTHIFFQTKITIVPESFITRIQNFIYFFKSFPFLQEPLIMWEETLSRETHSFNE